MKFNLEFTEEEINYILSAIAQRPFTECAAIINNIKSQAEAQVGNQELEEVE